MINLSQTEADALLAMEKHVTSDTVYNFPSLGGSVRIPLMSADRKKDFFLDITRSRIQIQKNTFQNRAKTSIILARVDIKGQPHCNPDGKEIPCPHIHLYKEGYADKWAYELPGNFTRPEDAWAVLQEFMAFCSVKKTPNINRDLFV